MLARSEPRANPGPALDLPYISPTSPLHLPEQVLAISELTAAQEQADAALQAGEM